MSPRRWIEQRREPWRTNLRAAWARAYVRIFAASREPSWILFETIMPVLGMFSYVFVYRALGAPREFEAFVVLGGYAGSTEVCTLVEAELERIVELTGAHEVNAVHTRCACTGDERCEFRLQWTSAMA